MYPWMCSWLWVVLAWMGSYCVSCDGQVLEDLIRFYGETNGQGWYKTWNTSTHYCDWYGVTCDADNALTILSLPSNNLVGTIPSNLSFISSLGTLDLSFNSLSGTLPEWSSVGAVSIRLNDNQFEGQIPVFEAPSLLVLLLNNNQFSGSIPIHDSWKGLAFMDVARNKISGTIPTYVNILSSLMLLNINHNDISGTLPSELFSVSSIQYLFLSHNKLFGDIPNRFELPQLSQLNLESNKLIGTLPEQYHSLPDLRSVNLFNNTCGGCSSFSDGWDFCKRGVKYHCGISDPCANITFPANSNDTFWTFNYSISCVQLVCSKQNSTCSSIVERLPESCSEYNPRTICVDDIYYLRAEVVNEENTTLALKNNILEVVGTLNVSTLSISNSAFVVNGAYSTTRAEIELEECTFRVKDRVDCVDSVIRMDPRSVISVDRCVNFPGSSIYLNLTNYTALGKFSVLNITNPDPRCTPVWPVVLPLVQNNIQCFRVNTAIRLSALEIETLVVPGCDDVPLSIIIPAVVGGVLGLALLIGLAGAYHRRERLATYLKHLRRNASDEKKEMEE